MSDRGQSSEGPAASTDPGGDRPRAGRRPRWFLLIAVTVVLAAIVGYGLTRIPESGGTEQESSEGPPAPADSDGDGLSDEVEESGWTTRFGTEYRTDADKADTDGDGLTDGDEAGARLALAQDDSARFGYSDPLLPDTDGDGLDDGHEAEFGLDPYNRDNDDDQIEDGYEVSVVGTDPQSADTDGDGFEDGFEVANREARGLAPLWPDVKVSKASYVTDFVKGFALGDLNREDSIAWLAGNLASGTLPIVGGFGDARDVIGSLIRRDWVGAAHSATGTIPVAGDASAIVGKIAEFLARNPQHLLRVAALVASWDKMPAQVKEVASRQIWRSWDTFTAARVSTTVLVQLQKGRTHLDDLADAAARPGHVEGDQADFFADRAAGEEWLADRYGANERDVVTDVRASTERCGGVCSPAEIRLFDVLVDGVAHEANVGYQRLRQVEMQIRSDAYLIENGEIDGAHWHFFASSYSNTIGADDRVFDLLEELEIPYTIHLPE